MEQMTEVRTPQKEFKDQTLAGQRVSEEERGWEPAKLGPNTYSTTEVVILYVPENERSSLNWEILETRRRSDAGIADCRGRWQGKWGTQLRPRTDASAKEAIVRGIAEFFGKDFRGELKFVGVTGPWVHRATTDGSVLQVLEESGESTPFQAPYYAFIADHRDFDPDGGHVKVNGNEEGGGTRWVRLGDLIAERGQDPTYLYWQMISRAVSHLHNPTPWGVEPRYYAPGEYPFIETE